MNIKLNIEDKLGAVYSLEAHVKRLRDDVKIVPHHCFPEKADIGEVIAHITLAYYRIQDARTRLELALEALQEKS